MCNNNCNKCNDPCNKCTDPCNKSKACGCSINLESKCVKYTGNDLSCTNIKKGTNLQDILSSLDQYLCFLLEEIINKSTIENIGGGNEIYSGRNDVTDANQLRTLVSSPTVTVITIDDTISFEALGQDIDISNIIENIGFLGLDVYKGFNSLTNKHEIKRITNPPTGASLLYNNPLAPDNISQRGLTSTDLEINELDGIVQVDTSTINENVGGKVEVYKGYSNSNKHEFRTLESTDNSVEIVNDSDKIDFKVYNPVINVGAFKVLDIGAGNVGDTFQVAGDITAAEITLVENSNQTEVLVTLNNPMLNSNYFVRVHFQSLDTSTTSDSERFSYKPITRDHTTNAFKLGLAKENSVVGTQEYLVVVEVVQGFFVFGTPPARFQIAEGECDNFDPNTVVWTDIYTDDAPNLQNGDIIYTDELETVPFDGQNLSYRIRQNPNVGNPFIIDVEFSVSNLGVVTLLSNCGAPTVQYQIASGDCSDNIFLLNWSDTYITRNGVQLTNGQLPEVGDIAYTDASLTTPVPSYRFCRIRVATTIVGNPIPVFLTFDYQFNTALAGAGEIALSTDCGTITPPTGTLVINSSVPDGSGNGTIDVDFGEPNEFLNLNFGLIFDSVFNFNALSITGAGLILSGALTEQNNTASGTIQLDSNGEATLIYNGQPTNLSGVGCSVLITSRTSTQPVPTNGDQQTIINFNN